MPFGAFATSVATMGAAGVNPLATAWRDAVVTAGGTVSAGRLSLISTLITGLEAAAGAASFDRFYVVGENEIQTRVCLFTHELYTGVSGPTFLADRYYRTNGGTYLNLGYNPASDGVAFTRNSAHYMFYMRNAPTEGNAFFGSVPTDAFSTGMNAFRAGTLYLRLNDDPETGGTIAGDDAVGLLAANRSGANAREAYQNGVSIHTYGDSPSRDVPNSVLAFGASGGWTSDIEVALLAWGGSLTPTQHANVATAAIAHLTAIGAAI